MSAPTGAPRLAELRLITASAIARAIRIGARIFDIMMSRL
jgi:hypothetical protein